MVTSPDECQVLILRPDGTQAEPNETGEVYLCSPTTRQPDYLCGGPPLRAHGAFLTLGDLGYLDDQGYLYLVGRDGDILNVGGANVYPAEVESVLLGYPGVADAAVVGRPHDYLGQVPHALIVPHDHDNPPDRWALDEHCRQRLSLPKVPLSYEFTDSVGRTEAGKLRRADLSTTKGPGQ